MSQAFQCDLCGQCISSEDKAKAEREVARQPATINGNTVDIGIIVKAYKTHVCNFCWSKVMKKVKAWADATLGE